MTAAENWKLLTHAVDDDGTPAIDRYLAASVYKKLRTKWPQLQSVHVEFKRGSDWHSANVGIEMPDDRKSVTPEGGARHLVAVAREFSASHHHKARIRLNALGESQSGTTSKSLWVLGLDFTEDDDNPEEAGPTPKDNVSAGKNDELIGMLEVMRTGTADAYTQRNTAIEQTTNLVDKMLKLTEVLAENQSGLLEAHKLDLKDKQEQRDFDAWKTREDHHAKRTDKLFDMGLGIGEKLIEQTLKDKFGMGSDAFDGTFSERLAAILKKVPKAKHEVARQVLTDDVWTILVDASKGVSDDAFRELVRQAAGKMPGDHSKLFMRLAVELDDKGVVMALGKLLTEAS